MVTWQSFELIDRSIEQLINRILSVNSEAKIWQNYKQKMARGELLVIAILAAITLATCQENESM